MSLPSIKITTNNNNNSNNNNNNNNNVGVNNRINYNNEDYEDEDYDDEDYDDEEDYEDDDYEENNNNESNNQNGGINFKVTKLDTLSDSEPDIAYKYKEDKTNTNHLDIAMKQTLEEDSKEDINIMNMGNMSGGGIGEKNNISDYKNSSNLVYFITAIIVINTIILGIYKNHEIFNFEWVEWYDKFRLFGVILDISSVLVLVILTQLVYKNNLNEKYGFSSFVFILTFILIKIFFDLMFYILVIKKTKSGENSLIDFLKRYCKTVKSSALLGSVISIIMISIFAIYLSRCDYWISIFIIVIFSVIQSLFIFYKN